MRCADCVFYECARRSPLGGCQNGEAVGQTVIITTPNTAQLDAGNLARTTDGIVKEELRIQFNPILRAASDLVDAVERYMRQECLRSELAMKKDKLKALLNESV